MSQKDQFERNCLEHPQQRIIVACSNEQCKEHRLLCVCCVPKHSSHNTQLFDIKQSENELQQHIRWVFDSNRIFGQWSQQNKKINSIQIQAECLSCLGEYEKSLNQLNEILRFNPLNFQAPNEIVYIIMWYKEPIELCNQIIEANLKNTILLSEIADQLLEMKQFRKAIIFYKQILEIDPDNEIAQSNTCAQEVKKNQKYQQIVIDIISEAFNEFQRMGKTIDISKKVVLIDSHNELALQYIGSCECNSLVDSISISGKIQEPVQFFYQLIQFLPNDNLTLSLIDKYAQQLEPLSESDESNYILGLDEQVKQQKLKAMEFQSYYE